MKNAWPGLCRPEEQGGQLIEVGKLQIGITGVVPVFVLQVECRMHARLSGCLDIEAKVANIDQVLCR